MAKKSTYKDYLKQEFGDLIEQLELPELQKRFMKNRWLDQLMWLEGRATKARNRHYTLRLLTIIGGVIVPALVSVNSANTSDRRLSEIFGWTAFGLSQVVAISAAVEELFHFGENRRRYRNSAEAMKIEAWQFFQLSGPYQEAENHEKAYPTFATNVENIIKQDVEGFVSQSALADAKSQERTDPVLAQNITLASNSLTEVLQRPPAPPVREVHEYSTTQSYHHASALVLSEGDEDEFVSPEHLQGNSYTTVTTEATQVTQTFTNSVPPGVIPEDDDDDFLTPDQLQGNQPQPPNPGGVTGTIPPANLAAFTPSTPPGVIPEDDDDFITPQQIGGNSPVPTNNGGVNSTSTSTRFTSVTSSTVALVSPHDDDFVTPDQIKPPGSVAPITPAPTPAPTPAAPPLATPEQVADILQCPLKDTQTYLPGVLAALEEKNILDRLTLIAAIATIGVETGGFRPIHEMGGPKYFAKYDGRRDLGNTKPGDGARYHGRGFVQITGRANYREYGEKLGLGSQLLDNPDLALDPTIAARILACYFYDRGVYKAARAKDWQKVRKIVNGGYNHLDKLNKYVQRALQKI